MVCSADPAVSLYPLAQQTILLLLLLMLLWQQMMQALRTQQ
jgi:hypothetical protein